ncbi:MAG: chromophore lyase CpcT/CpeT [Cyanobacteria bacterium J06643_4]
MTAPTAAHSTDKSTPPKTTEAATQDLVTLATWMAGDFSNFDQANAHPTDFAHIRIFFRPLPYEFFEVLGFPGGIGFYSEQVYDYDLWNPYRQGLHRVVAKDDHVYIENYGFQDGVPYAGSGHNRDVLKTIPADCAIRREGCSMVFRRQRDDDGKPADDKFIGSVEPGNNCRIPRKGKLTYLVSHVEVTDHSWLSLDQGMDIETHEHVWGSTEGALKFTKRESFAAELPLDRLLGRQ